MTRIAALNMLAATAMLAACGPASGETIVIDDTKRRKRPPPKPKAPPGPSEAEQEAMRKAEAKRARKAEKRLRDQ